MSNLNRIYNEYLQKQANKDRVIKKPGSKKMEGKPVRKLTKLT